MIVSRKKTGRYAKIGTQASGNRSAAVLIEMACILPVILLILVLAVDMARFLIVSMSLNNALNQGLVAGSNNALNITSTATWSAGIENAIRQSMSQYGWYQPNDLTVTIPIPSVSNGLIDSSGFRTIQVSATYQTQFVIPWQGLSGRHQLHLTMQTDQVR